MADSLKLLGSTISVNTTATSFNSASLVRLLNIDSTPHFITHAYANGVTIGTVVLTANGGDGACVDLMKEPTDTIKSDTASANLVYGVSIGFY